jgi:hypothetical protein
MNPISELKDIFRDDTIDTCREYLNVAGLLEDIGNIPLLICKQITILSQTTKCDRSSYATKFFAKQYVDPTFILQRRNEMNPTPVVQPPSHARRWKHVFHRNYLSIHTIFLGIITCCSHGIGSQNVKKRGHGPVRALTVVAKRPLIH